MNSMILSSLAGIFFFISTISAQSGDVVVGSNGNCCAQSDVFSVQSQVELDLLNPCTTFSGTIAINVPNSISLTVPPGLTTIIGHLMIIGPVQSIEAVGLTAIYPQYKVFPNDTNAFYTDGSLWIDRYPATTPLSKLSFPKLIHVRELRMLYITGLQTIDGFPALSAVDMDLYLNGTFTKVLFPNLTYVDGEFTVTSTDSNFQCPFTQFVTNGVLQPRQDFTCGYVNNATRLRRKPEFNSCLQE